MLQRIPVAFALLQQPPPVLRSGITADQVIALEATRHHIGPPGIPLIPLSFFALVLAIVWLAFRRKQLQIRARSELHKQLLDKFNSGHELGEFLESKGGERFLGELSSQHLNTKDRILGTLRAGVVLSVFGCGFLVLATVHKGLVFPGVLVLSLGIGLLMATALSYRIAKRWLQSHQGSEPGIG